MMRSLTAKSCAAVYAYEYVRSSSASGDTCGAADSPFAGEGSQTEVGTDVTAGITIRRVGEVAALLTARRSGLIRPTARIKLPNDW